MFLFIISGIVAFAIYSIHRSTFPMYVEALIDTCILVLAFMFSLTIYPSLLFNIANMGFKYFGILAIVGLVVVLGLSYLYMMIINEYYNESDTTYITKENMIFVLLRSISVYGLEIFLIGFIALAKYLSNVLL